MDRSFIHQHISELCFTFPLQLNASIHEQSTNPQGDNTCLLSHNANSFDQLIDASHSGASCIAYICSRKALLRKCSSWGNMGMCIRLKLPCPKLYMIQIGADKDTFEKKKSYSLRQGHNER